MAGKGERRMLFDTRGRRRNVIRVVYAVLALLMGGSLFLTVGPFNIGEFLGGQSTSSADEVLDDQAERVEARLAKNPDDEALLLSLTRARISAGNAEIEPAAPGEVKPIPPAATEDYGKALTAWNRYLKLAGDEPNPSAAQLVATTFFNLAERGATSFREIESSIDTAAEAQRIVVKERPSNGSLSFLAIYEYFNGDFAAGDKAKDRALAGVGKGEAKNIGKQLAQYRKRAKQFDKQRQQLAKTQKEANRQELQSIFGNVGTGASGE